MDCVRNKNCEMLALGAQAGQEVAELMLKQGGHFYVCGSARQVPEDIYTAMKEAASVVIAKCYADFFCYDYYDCRCYFIVTIAVIGSAGTVVVAMTIDGSCCAYLTCMLL